jgi:DNA-binding NarL/FixJ family response regulator
MPSPPTPLLASTGVRTILICDDAVGFAVLARAWLNADPELTVVGIAHTAAEALSEAELHQPSIIVLDRMLPDVDGVDTVVEDLRNRSPDSAIVLTSSLPEALLVADAERVGADATFPKAAPAAGLLAAVTAAADRRVNQG